MKLLYENLTERYDFRRFQDMNFPAHLHTDLEILMVTGGKIGVTAGQQQKELTAGQLAVIFPHQIHAYVTEPEVGSDGILAICSPSSFGEFQSILTRQHPVDPFVTASGLHRDIPYSLKGLLRMAEEEQQNLPAARALLHLLLARLLPLLSLQNNRDSQPMDQTTLLIQYLSEHFTEAVSLQTLAEQLHISRYSVSRIFSEKLNTSFPCYLNTLRIDHAKKLLRTTRLDMLTVSESCGYETLRTFNREFQAHCGCSPRAFRKEQGGG